MHSIQIGEASFVGSIIKKALIPHFRFACSPSAASFGETHRQSDGRVDVEASSAPVTDRDRSRPPCALLGGDRSVSA
jgi:hypothetical protein